MVEVEEAGGRARDGVAALVELLEAIEVLRQQLRQALRAVGDPPLVHLVDQRLGSVERLADVLRHRVAELGDLPGHADQPPQQRVLLHDPGVATGVGGGRRRRHDLRQHGVPADRLEQVGAAQLVGHGDRVGGLPRRVERVDRVVDVAVGRLVEVGRRDHPGGRRDGLGREHHGPEQGLLRLEVVGRHPAGGLASGARFLIVGSGRHGGFTFLQPACGLPEAQPWGNPGDVGVLTVDGPVDNLAAGARRSRREGRRTGPPTRRGPTRRRPRR